MKLSAIISGLSGLLLAGAAFGSVAEDLRAFEGLRLSCYLDTTNHWTVGYGRRCEKGAVMTKEQAESALSDDIAKAEQGARRVFPSYDSQPQHVQDVLVELCFQLGAAGMRKFVHFGQAIQSRDYALASACLIDSRFHKQCKARCEALAGKLNP